MIPHSFNPSARHFKPDSSARIDPQKTSTPQQVSAPPSPYLEARLLNLEAAYFDLRGDLNTLKDDLGRSFGEAKPQLPKTDLTKSRQSAMQFKQELEQLSREVHLSVDGNADDQKANGNSKAEARGSVPPHARAVSVTSHGSGRESLPPHLRKSNPPTAVNAKPYVFPPAALVHVY